MSAKPYNKFRVQRAFKGVNGSINAIQPFFKATFKTVSLCNLSVARTTYSKHKQWKMR